MHDRNRKVVEIENINNNAVKCEEGEVFYD